MLLEKIPAGVYGVNCYILGDEKTNKAAVIDPGGDADKIINFLEENEIELQYIILTHGHGDHIGGVNDLKNKYNVPVCLHEGDSIMIQDSNINHSAAMGGGAHEFKADQLLVDGEILELGELKLEIIHTPGHTKGGICVKVENLLFTGDTLFANSIGRTDLEGGDYEEIIKSIKNKLMILDEDTTVLPGHGPASRIGIEKLTNPYIK